MIEFDIFMSNKGKWSIGTIIEDEKKALAIGLHIQDGTSRVKYAVYTNDETNQFNVEYNLIISRIDNNKEELEKFKKALEEHIKVN